MTPSLMVEPLKPGTFGGVFVGAAPATAASPVTPTATATASTTPRSRPSFFPRILFTPFGPSVRERPRFEVCLNPSPDPGQASRLEDQEHDDQQGIDDCAQRALRKTRRAGVVGDDRPPEDREAPVVRHELLDDLGERGD